MARFDLSAAIRSGSGDRTRRHPNSDCFAASLDLQGRATEAARSARKSSSESRSPHQALCRNRTGRGFTDKAARPAASQPQHGVALASRTETVRQNVPVEPPRTDTREDGRPSKAALRVAQGPVAPSCSANPADKPGDWSLGDDRAAPRAAIAKAPPAKSTAESAVAVALAPVRPLPVAPPPKPAVENAATIPPPVTPMPVKPKPVTPPTPAVESAVIMARTERDVVKVSGKAKTGPRLERLSLREVELITVPGPQWRALTVSRTQRSATVRFVPLRQAALRPVGVRILNAARTDRLAARTRKYSRAALAGNLIGEPAVRMRSVTLSASRRRTAKSFRRNSDSQSCSVQRPQ